MHNSNHLETVPSVGKASAHNLQRINDASLEHVYNLVFGSIVSPKSRNVLSSLPTSLTGIRRHLHSKVPGVFLQQLPDDDTALLARILSNNPYGTRQCLLNDGYTKMLVKILRLDILKGQ